MVGERDLRRTFPCLSEGETLLLTDLRTTSGVVGSADLPDLRLTLLSQGLPSSGGAKASGGVPGTAFRDPPFHPRILEEVPSYAVPGAQEVADVAQ